MAMPKNVIPSRKICVFLPETEAARLDLFLFSEAENRIPQGAYRDFLLKALREVWEYKILDLAPYCNSPAGLLTVKGESEAIRTLEAKLKGA